MNFFESKKLFRQIIILLTFFALWFFYWSKYYHYLGENKEKNIVDNVNNLKENSLNLDKLKFVYESFKKEYYDFDKVEVDNLLESSIAWLIYWAKDPHSQYFTKEENIDFQESLSWDFHWIWAILEKVDLWVKIMSVLPKSPAEKAQIKENDVILTVNWKNISQMKVQEVIALIKWPVWKEVNLEIKRWDEIIYKKVFTWEIVFPSISVKDLENDIWYIAISTFWSNTSKDFFKEFEKFKNKKWIIIDLRQNSWWFLTTSNDILSNFVKKWELILTTKYKDWKEDKYFSEWWNFDFDWKIVILIDENSASASEIFAWTMRDYKKAILVWKKSYWKGSVQSQIEFPDKSMLKVTVAKWFTPSWVNIDKQWIKPDIEVNFKKEDIEKKYDRQLEEAKKVLESFIKNDYLQLSIDKYNEKVR